MISNLTAVAIAVAIAWPWQSPASPFRFSFVTFAIGEERDGSDCEGAKLSAFDISKAYGKKALDLHPDKRLDDPIKAHINFQKLKTSYDILRDEKKRKLFDDLLRMKREMIQLQVRRQQEDRDSKRRKIDVFVPDINLARLEEEERIAVKLLGEIARIHEILLSKKEPSSSELCVDKEKVLKVSWGKTGEDYSCQRLKELFSDFGKVEKTLHSC